MLVQSGEEKAVGRLHYGLPVFKRDYKHEWVDSNRPEGTGFK